MLSAQRPQLDTKNIKIHRRTLTRSLIFFKKKASLDSKHAFEINLWKNY